MTIFKLVKDYNNSKTHKNNSPYIRYITLNLTFFFLLQKEFQLTIIWCVRLFKVIINKFLWSSSSLMIVIWSESLFKVIMNAFLRSLSKFMIIITKICYICFPGPKQISYISYFNLSKINLLYLFFISLKVLFPELTSR